MARLAVSRIEELHVVETIEDTRYLGSLALEPDGRLRIETHRAGHPVFLEAADIARIIPAELHPDVCWDDYVPLQG